MTSWNWDSSVSRAGHTIINKFEVPEREKKELLATIAKLKTDIIDQ